MRLIDSHCHLDFPEFDADRADVLLRAMDSGVSDFILPGVTADRWDALITLCRGQENLHLALGLHPCFMAAHQPEELQRLESLLQSSEAVAVGEIGLDLFIPEASLEQQVEYLLPQLEMAKMFNLPVILHVRKAHDQMLKLLRSRGLQRGGIVHAFSGSAQQARQYLELGFKLGIGGSITYERAKKLRRIVTELPLESFVLETDSPDMPLAGFQGQRNEPERVLRVADEMAQIRGVELAEVARVTTANSQQIYAPRS